MKDILRVAVRCLLLLALATPSFSQVRRPARPQPRPPSRPAPAYLQQLKALEETPYLTRGVLKNGLTVLVREFRAYPLVDVTTCVRGGYGGTSPGSEEMARVLERLYFEATTTHPSAVIASDIRAMGGIPASTVSYSCVFHDLVAPAQQWKKALEIQADALLNLALDPEEIRLSAEYVANADRLALEEPGEAARRRLMQLAFGPPGPMPGTPPVWYAAGGGPGRDQLLSFYRAAYDPSRVILVISGAVNSGEVLNEVVRLYNRPKAAGGATAVPAPQRAVQQGFRYSAMNRPGADARVLIGFRVAPASSPDYPALAVLSALLGSGESSVLASRVRDEKKVILDGSTRLEGDSSGGYLEIELRAEPSNLDRCEIAVMTEIEILKSTEPDEEDLSRATAQLEREFWERQQTITQKAHELARFEGLGRWKEMNQFIPGIRKVKPSDVSRVAKRFLNLDDCAMVESLPPGTENRNMSADTMQSTLQALLSASAEQAAEEREKETRLAILPPGGDVFKYSEIQYPMTKASVLRGPELFIQEDHSLPLLHVGFFYPGGKLLENQEDNGISALLLRTLLLASRGGEAARLRRQLGINGAHVTPFVGDDYFGFMLTGLSASAEADLQVLDRFLEFPKLDTEEFERIKRIQLGWAQDADTTPIGRALTTLDQTLFLGQPYGRPPEGTPAGINSISVELLRAWYDTSIHNRRPIVLIVGDTQGTSLAGIFVRRFSGARFQDVKIPEAAAGTGERKRTRIEGEPAGPGSAALIGFLAPPSGDEDSYAMMVLQAHLSGTAGLLNESLQSQRVAGCASSTYVQRARGGTQSLFAVAGPGMEGRLSDALEAAVRGLRDQPILYKDYRSAVNSAVGRYWVAQQDRAGRILNLATAIVSGQPFDEILDSVVRLQQVTEEDLQDVAQRLLNLDKAVVIRMPAGPQR